jgi:hypothetical protein
MWTRGLRNGKFPSRIHITGPDIDFKLDFIRNCFSDAKDVDILKHVWAYKKQLGVFRRMDFYPRRSRNPAS